MDIWSIEKRSLVMSKIRGRNTKPERVLRSALFRLGYRYRIHDKILPGKPDIVLKKYRTVIFVNGCFWHHHNCKEGKIPSSNSSFWEKKLNGTIERDASNVRKLEEMNWKVIIIWECEIEKVREKTIKAIVSKLEDVM